MRQPGVTDLTTCPPLTLRFGLAFLPEKRQVACVKPSRPGSGMCRDPRCQEETYGQEARRSPKPARPAKKTVNLLPKGFTFEHLVKSIHAVHSEAAVQATRAVNLSLTLRNWLIGCYIAEYELRGNDRATYGEKLLDSLAAEPTRFAVSNTNRRQLYRYLRFYRTYPGMVGALSPQFRALLPAGVSAGSPKVGTSSPQSSPSAETQLNRLSYRHLELIVDQDDERKRDFYTVVEYALAGIDNHLFVSKYELHLPDREQLRRELERSLQGKEQA